MHFQIYPAVDIKGGRAVRLLRGEMSEATVYGSPVEMAQRWAEEGAEWLHLVDLDGAVAGRPVNLSSISAVLAAVDVPVQLGGGLRDADSIAAAISAGCERVVLGSAAVEDPELAAELAARWPGRISLGLDLRGLEIATKGWTGTSTSTVEEIIDCLGEAPFGCLITTDISRDGAMTGPGVDSLAHVLDLSPWPVIASGGIRSADDVRLVAAIERNGTRVAGAIVGRALYEEATTLKELVAAAGEAG